MPQNRVICNTLSMILRRLIKKKDCLTPNLRPAIAVMVEISSKGKVENRPFVFHESMSNICYSENHPIGHYDTHHLRDDMNTQFASKASTSITSFNSNFTVHQASYKKYNEDRIAVLKTGYGLIIGVFDGTHYQRFI